MSDESIVREHVKNIYKAMCDALGRYSLVVEEDSRIKEDLRFTISIRESMSEPLSQYTARYGAKRIVRSESKSFKKIKNAADLVLKKIKSAEQG